MLKNYIKIAWRNFLRNKSYSFINVLGLAIGLGCLMLILLFVTDELSYDKFHQDREQIHFIGSESEFGRNLNKSLTTPYPLGPSMKEEIPEVEHFVITLNSGMGKVSIDGENFSDENDILFATEDFFEVFNFPLKSGNPLTILENPRSIVITEKVAQRYFGDENPLEKTMTIDRYGNEEFIVTGIAENMQYNSFLNFSFVTSLETNQYAEMNRESWKSSMFQLFIKLQKGSDWNRIEPKVAELVNKNIGEDSKTRFFPIPVDRLYLSDLVTRNGFHANLKYIYIFSAIGLFILILACINYMNLATARAIQRSGEVGIRKVAGADKTQLIIQFIGEAVVVTFFAFLLAILIVEISLPFFNDFIGKEFHLSQSENIAFISSLFGISILTGIISGSYPAFFLSRFKPVDVLKGQTHKLLTGSGLRKTLVTVQFTVSTILIICTLIASNQLRYMLDKDLGFQDEQVMYVPAYQIQDQVEVLKHKALGHSSVLDASAATDIPGQFGHRISQAFDPQNVENIFDVHFLRSDADYDDVLGLELIAGRYFDEARISDRDNASVINEAMVQELGWESAEQAIGNTFYDSSQIVGVVKDFHFKSLHSEISSVYIRMKPSEAGGYDNYNMLLLRFNPEQTSDVVSHLQEVWDSFDTGEPLVYHFLDEKFAEQYETDQKMSLAFSVFAGIAIFIACLGLFGLAAFTSERRTKEIGIRKVLGASLTNIMVLLSREFIKLVVIGFVLAIPIAWYAMNLWLADFAYRIEIGPGIFALAGGAALMIALLTVSWQSIKAALANPVDSLRNE